MKTTHFFILYRLIALFLLLWAPLSDAATIIVDSVADPAESGKCTLRQAIENAQDATHAYPDCDPGSAGVDDIVFALTTPATINLTEKLPALKEDVNIINDTGDSLTVRRDIGGDYRIFTIKNGTTVIINGLTIENGYVTGDGGGIYNEGTLEIIHCNISNNEAGDGGGGIRSEGYLEIQHSTISENSSTNKGGGILNASGSNMIIIGSTISQNTLSGNSIFDTKGAGIYNKGTLDIINSTISGNTMLVGSGAGIYQSGEDILDITNSTITNNSISSPLYGMGGGIIKSSSSSGLFKIKNSIIAGNSASSMGGTYPDISGDITGNNHNLIGDINGNTGTLGTGSDIVNPSPLLGPLQNNDGPTETHALLSGSPAIDAGDNTLVTESTDQRGTGFDRIIGNVDIGAFEVNLHYEFSAKSYEIVEGDSPNITNVVEITRMGDIYLDSSIEVVLTGNSATAGIDFTDGPITLNFRKNEITQSVPIELLGNTQRESDRTISLSLDNFIPTGTKGSTNPTATFIIKDDDNNAPTLDNSTNITLTDIDENDTNSEGDLISTLIQNQVNDLDSDPIGIAVTAIDNSNGTWQHQAHGSTDFIDFPDTVAENQALLLDKAIKIRFVPNLDYVGQAQIRFRAWDKTSGTHGDSNVDTTKNGDPTAFSVDIATATITVNPVVEEEEPATSEEPSESEQQTKPKKPAESEAPVELEPEKSEDTEKLEELTKPDEPIEEVEEVEEIPQSPKTPSPPSYQLEILKPNRGIVKGEGIDCGRNWNCTQYYISNTLVELEILPNHGFFFQEWKGEDCADSFQIKNDMTCEAIFARIPAPKYSSKPMPNQSLEFGESEIGTPMTLTIEIQETGIGDLEVIDYSITGEHVLDFSITDPEFPFFIVDGGDAQTITVQCNPSEAGPRTATLQINSNDIENPTATYSLVCQGLSPDDTPVNNEPNSSVSTETGTTTDLEISVVEEETLTETPVVVDDKTSTSQNIEEKTLTETPVVVDDNTTTSQNTETQVIVDDTTSQNTVETETPPVIIVKHTTENSVETSMVENEDSTTSQDIIETKEPTVPEDNLIETEDSTLVDNPTDTEILDVPQEEITLIPPETTETEATTEPEDEIIPENRTLTVTTKGKGIVIGYSVSKINFGLQENGLQDGIHCGTDCTAIYPEGTTVTLNPMPNKNHQFAGWSAGCKNSLILNSDLTCIAHFQPMEYTLTINQTPAATITSTSDNGINCGMDCTENYPINALVTLKANPTSEQWLFDGWVGCEDGAVTMSEDRTCSAIFQFDKDGDHIPDNIENGAPFGGDGNGDGKPDSQQLHVTSFIDEQTDSYITVVLDDTKDCAIEDIQTEILETPSGFDISTLNFQFTEQCSQADMSVYYHNQQSTFHEAYYEYGDQADNYLSAQGWHNPYGILPETVMIQGQAVTKASLTLLKKEEEVPDSLPTSTDAKQPDDTLPDDEGPKDAIHFSEKHYYVNEDDGIVKIPVIRHGTNAGEVCVNYGAFGYHAQIEQDYQILPNENEDNQNKICWASNEEGRKTFTVAIIDNTIPKDKSRELQLSLLARHEQVELTIEKAIVTIRNDDFPPCSTTLTHQNLKGQKCQAGGQTITGDVIIESEPEPGNGTIIIGAIFEDQVIKGNGRLEQATFKAPVINKHGIIADSAFYGEVENVDTIKDSVFHDGHIQQSPEALIDNATVGHNVTIHGGRLSGTVKSQGTLVDIKFNGDSLEGGHLQGIIQNNGGGIIKDVNLMASPYSMTSITGGQIAGKITGEKEQPAVLQDVVVLAGSQLKNVIIGENVQLADNVRLENVQSLDDSIVEVQPEDEITDEITPENREKATGVCHNALVFVPQSQGNSEEINSQTCFTTQLNISEQQNARTRFSYAEAQEVELSVTIHVASDDVGQQAEILIVAIHDNLTHPIVYTRKEETWHVWDSHKTAIPVVEDYQELPKGPLEITIYQGNLVEDLGDNLGEFTVYVGYRLKNDGTIIYNGHYPIHLFWGNARSIETQTHDLCEVTPNNENDVTSFFANRTGFKTPFGRKDSLDVIRINVDPRHIGQLADIYRVAISEDHLKWYDGDTWQNWNCQDRLQPTQSEVLSEETLEITIEQSNLRNLSDELMIYVGYRVDGENRIIFRGMTR